MGDDKEGMEFLTEQEINTYWDDMREVLIRQAVPFFEAMEDASYMHPTGQGVVSLGTELESCFVHKRDKSRIYLAEKGEIDALVDKHNGMIAAEFSRAFAEKVMPDDRVVTPHMPLRTTEDFFVESQDALRRAFSDVEPVDIGGHLAFGWEELGTNPTDFVRDVIYPAKRYQMLVERIHARNGVRKFKIDIAGGTPVEESTSFWVGYGQSLQQTEKVQPWLFTTFFETMLLEEPLMIGLAANSAIINRYLTVWDDTRLPLYFRCTDDGSDQDLKEGRYFRYRPLPVWLAKDEHLYADCPRAFFDQGVLKDTRIPENYRHLLAHLLKYKPIFVPKINGFEGRLRQLLRIRPFRKKGLFPDLMDSSWAYERFRVGWFEKMLESEGEFVFALEKRGKAAQCSSYENAALVLFDMYSCEGMAIEHYHNDTPRIPVSRRLDNITIGFSAGRFDEKEFYVNERGRIVKKKVPELMEKRLRVAEERMLHYGHDQKDIDRYLELIARRSGCKHWLRRHGKETYRLPTGGEWQRERAEYLFCRSNPGRRIPRDVISQIMEEYQCHAKLNIPIGTGNNGG